MPPEDDDHRNGAATRADALDRADLAASAQGDRAAFERLYRRYFQRLARFLRRFSGRADLIEDVINQALWVVWSKAAAFRGEARVGTWITGIAYRCMLKALRDASGAAHEPLHEVFDDDAEDTANGELGPGHDGGDLELRDWVAKGLRLLPEDQRTTMELAYLAGLSCAEIGQLMGCAEGTVKARMFHARLRLRNLMPALGGMDEPERDRC